MQDTRTINHLPLIMALKVESDREIGAKVWAKAGFALIGPGITNLSEKAPYLDK